MTDRENFTSLPPLMRPGPITAGHDDGRCTDRKTPRFTPDVNALQKPPHEKSGPPHLRRNVRAARKKFEYKKAVPQLPNPMERQDIADRWDKSTSPVCSACLYLTTDAEVWQAFFLLESGTLFPKKGGGQP